ncbi:MAG: hypothetical protein AB7F86_05755 [Bdellovibrionales bacterium]
MLSQGAKLAANIPLSLLGMMIFLVVFLGISIWVMWRPGARSIYQARAALPLNDEGDEA